MNHDSGAFEMHGVLFHGILKRLRTDLVTRSSHDHDAIDSWIHGYLYACIMFSPAGNVYCTQLCRITTPFFEIADALNGLLA